MIKYIVTYFFLLSCCAANVNAIEVSSGKLVQLDNLPSKLIKPRNVLVWLPNEYAANENQKFDVLYMHDGQMLFDKTSTWNGQEWGVDEIASKLITQKAVRPFIVVGIFNGGIDRHNEYFPQKAADYLTPAWREKMMSLKRDPNTNLFGGPLNADHYLKYLVTELKPYIDQNFRVNTEKHNTYLMGSSMGGLISMYAVTQYPEVFGGAACLSTHWLGIMPQVYNPVAESLITYFEDNITAPNNNRWYFDYGDQTLDAYYPHYQKRIDAIMHSKGFDDSHWQSYYFPGADHSENAWNGRLALPLQFLFSNK